METGDADILGISPVPPVPPNVSVMFPAPSSVMFVMPADLATEPRRMVALLAAMAVAMTVLAAEAKTVVGTPKKFTAPAVVRPPPPVTATTWVS